jgi:prepilin-type N-terminal cleavage/methylation domain-containing protein
MRERSRGGFTLIEMVIVLILLGMAATIAYPKVARITTHARVNQATMVAAHTLVQAVTDAARQRKPIRVARGADLQSITVSDRATGTVLTTRVLGAGDGYYLDSVAFSVTPVDIFPNGFTSSALTLTLWNAGYSRQVTMSRAGWVRTP